MATRFNRNSQFSRGMCNDQNAATRSMLAHPSKASSVSRIRSFTIAALGVVLAGAVSRGESSVATPLICLSSGAASQAQAGPIRVSLTLGQPLASSVASSGNVRIAIGFWPAAASCPADFNSDGLVDDADFQIFVVAYDALVIPPASPICDLNSDGFVDDQDFTIFLGAYNALLCS